MTQQIKFLRLLTALLAVVSVTPVLVAQQPFIALQGDWVGKGTLSGRPARFTMSWQVQGAFAHLDFNSAMVDSLGRATPVIGAAAVYRTDPNHPEGVWLDSRPVRIELAWATIDSALVVTWTAPTESGRTSYRLLASGGIEVIDEVLSGQEWRTFGRAVYRRERPETQPSSS